MKERPILFSGPMVRAILAGTKTQTRRVVTLTDSGRVKAVGSARNWHLDDPEAVLACPYGQPGDRLWVQEEHRCTSWRLDTGHVSLAYKADYGERRCQATTEECLKLDARKTPLSSWMRGRFMLRSFSRITLEIESVRIERLHDISKEDCRAEGCHGGNGSIPNYAFSATPCEHYRHVWKSINPETIPALDSEGKRIGMQPNPARWDANPWVWVVTFKRVEGRAA